MKRFIVIGLVLSAALIGTASAGTFVRYVDPPNASGVRMAAGYVLSDGTIKGGSGFTVRHIANGQYMIDFDRGYFTSCAAMTVTNAEYPTFPIVTQQRCGNVSKFLIVLRQYNCSCALDAAFQFTAVQESP